MNAFIDQAMDQSAQVARANEQAQRATDARETKEIKALAAQATKRIVSQISARALHGDLHRFEAYGNPKMNPGCVRCSYPKVHHIHPPAR